MRSWSLIGPSQVTPALDAKLMRQRSQVLEVFWDFPPGRRCLCGRCHDFWASARKIRSTRLRGIDPPREQRGAGPYSPVSQ